MPRSYLYINKSDLDIYFNKEIYQADAIIIDIYDASHIFSNFEKYEEVFKKYKELGIQVYLRLDTKDFSKCFKALDKTNGEYITGWAIPHASLRILNKLVMKARDYEQKQKLSFGLLNFIAIIDTPEGILNYRRIAAYERVKALNIDEKSYTTYLGLDYYSDNSYVRDQVALFAAISKKPLIDSVIDDYELLNSDLIKGKRLGAISKATNDLKQLKLINEFYIPSKNEINEAKLIVSTYLNSSKKERKNLMINSEEISQHKIIRSQEVLNRANDLGLDDENLDLRLTVKAEKLKDASKKIHPKKFYTIGEEIGNAVTHGVGILFSIIYLIMLLFKARNGEILEAAAYAIYALSAFILYFSSTLYHGLPLGSRSKKLFQKFDHMTIYLLIAGTYTPFTLVALGGSLGLNLFIILWVGAISGLLLNLFWFGKFRLLHMILYVALGWVAIFYIKSIALSIGQVGTAVLIAGGAAYTLGIIFYGLKLFKFTHMVWHLFVLAGTILHFLTIYLYL